MTLKEKIIKYFEEIGKTDYRIRYFPCSRYQKRYKKEFQEEECWIYPKTPQKEQKIKIIKGQTYYIINKDGSPKMVNTPGILVTSSDFNSGDFMDIMFKV